MSPAERIREHLAFLYGPERAAEVYARLDALLAAFRARCPRPAADGRLTERDVVLITYGDQVQEPGRPPLRTLAEVLEKYVAGTVSTVHLLPFFPYSSDDGFSVTDYTAVSPALGDWEDIARLGRRFRLMLDAVINHISAQSAWFQGFLRGEPEYRDFFITVEDGDDADLSKVVRPRALPLLTRFGDRLVWTTFSADQVDLNYANPEVLLRVIEVLLYYVERGAGIIRLDAIAYLWKRPGTTCIHLEETHRVVKLFRAVLDAVAPQVLLITETNVPHAENVSYFGDGTDEAQMVYQFPLPPLVLYSILSGDGSHLSAWAAGLRTPSASTTFFNFLASHDGIGLRPVEGILSPAEVQMLVERTLAHGGYVSYKDNPGGPPTVYELNISYFDALSDPQGGEPVEVQVRRFLLSQAIMLSLAGVPGIYIHSLFGSRSWREGVEVLGHNRAINRQKFRRAALEQALSAPSTLRYRVFHAYRRLIRARVSRRAFHPQGAQEVVDGGPGLFALWRTSPQGDERVLCLHNLTGERQVFRGRAEGAVLRDIITGRAYPVGPGGDLTVTLAPYQAVWLVGDGD